MDSCKQATATSGEEIIDIAEYFGSQEIEKASLIKYMQLKHSTLQATDSWTASGLEKTIKAYAQRYKELLQNNSVDFLENKLQFWFVTNRPISIDFYEAVVDAASNSAARHTKELEKIENFVGLT